MKRESYRMYFRKKHKIIKSLSGHTNTLRAKIVNNKF